jgi:hypothetical protein
LRGKRRLLQTECEGAARPSRACGWHDPRITLIVARPSRAGLRPACVERDAVENNAAANMDGLVFNSVSFNTTAEGRGSVERPAAAVGASGQAASRLNPEICVICVICG